MPKHRDGHPHVLPLHPRHGGAHLTAERPGHGPGSRSVVVLAVCLAVLAVAGIAAAVRIAGGPDHEKPAAGVTLAQTAATRDLRGCQASWRAVHRVLRSAEPSMHQWEVHVGAMNRLVAGRITLAQASTFWAQTRQAAQRRYDAFATRDRALRRSGVERHCPSTGPGGASSALAGCERAVSAATDTLSAARTALTRWSHHIVAMDQLRSGMLSPAMAQSMWQASWPRGAAELRVYRQRERLSSGLRCPA